MGTSAFKGALSTALILGVFVVSAPAQRVPIRIELRPDPTDAGQTTASAVSLTAADVNTIVTNAALEAQKRGVHAVIAVVDREENILGVFQMTGAPRQLRLVGRRSGSANDGRHGLDGLTLGPNGDTSAGVVAAGPGIPDPTILAALSKAGTAAVFETTGNAFTTRTASFIIQEHFPPTIDFTSGGPLFGVQFSNLPCTDVKKVDPGNGNLALPLGLSADAGGLPLYKSGQPVGGIGVEADGIYTADLMPMEKASTNEELVALAGTRGYEAPSDIRGDQIFVNGIRLPFADAETPDAVGGSVPPGAFVPGLFPGPAPRDGLSSVFVPVTIAGLAATVDPRFFPFVASAETGGLTSGDVQQIISQGLAQAYQTRAAIRRPLGSFAQVNVAVVDASGKVLGIARTPDAPVFGFDVSAQKARAAAFFSSGVAAAALSSAGFGEYVSNALSDGLRLDGSVAFSDRANGFLSRPFFPDGINDTPAGPFSRPYSEWSVFNVGLQVDLLRSGLLGIVTGVHPIGPPCTDIPAIKNGIQIFPGSVPLYKNGVLVGGVGVSGDGVDQDDIVAAMGSAGFEAPAQIRSDHFFVRGVRLPWVKFPRHPNL